MCPGAAAAVLERVRRGSVERLAPLEISALDRRSGGNLLGCVLARIDGKSRVEYLTERKSHLPLLRTRPDSGRHGSKEGGSRGATPVDSTGPAGVASRPADRPPGRDASAMHGGIESPAAGHVTCSET